MSQASALIDLLMTKLVDEDRAGQIEYKQSQWVGNLACLAAHVRVNLSDTFYAYHKSLRGTMRCHEASELLRKI